MKNNSKLMNSVNEMMKNQRGNCAQCIFATFGPFLAKEKLDYESCMKITSAFGGGINLAGNVCGAITGALMVIGLISNGNMQQVTQLSNLLFEEFKKINGTIICRELIGHDMSDVQKLNASDQEDVFNRCKRYVVDSARILENIIEDQMKKEQ